jgi:hypothetical protein
MVSKKSKKDDFRRILVPPSKLLCPHDFDKWTEIEAVESRAASLRDELSKTSRNRDAWRKFAQRCVTELLMLGGDVPEGEPPY